jgi:coenzyme Q-binding protein COQ10
MPKYNVTRIVPFNLDQVFAIASDVGSYNKFLPLVRKSLVRNRQILPDGRETFDAELVVAYKKLGIEEAMVSKVIVDHANGLVTAQSSEGPVKYLNSEWKLVSQTPTSCEIQFTVDYELKSRSMQFILSGMFDMIVRRIFSAFVDRATKLYGATV